MSRRLDDINFHKDLARDEWLADNEAYEAECLPTLPTFIGSQPAKEVVEPRTAPKRKRLMAVDSTTCQAYLIKGNPIGWAVTPDDRLTTNQLKARGRSIARAFDKRSDRIGVKVRY